MANDVHEMLSKIQSPEQLADFLNALAKDNLEEPSRRKKGEHQWENQSIDEYLEAIAAWLESFPQSYINSNQPIPKDINWRFLGEVFYIGKIYE